MKSGCFHILACLTIVFAGFVIYSNTIHSSFQFDDYPFIVENPLIQSLHNIPSFFSNNDHTFAARGLTTTTFAINYYFSGLAVEQYHWVNIALHILNGMLVYLVMITILARCFPDQSDRVHIVALFTALLFVTSPIQVHTTTYICQRNGLLASFFYLLSLLFFMQAIAVSKIRITFYIASMLSFLAAIWCKEMACTAPIIMFLYYRCFIAKESSGGFKLIIPHVVLWLVSFYFSVITQHYTMIQMCKGVFREYLLTQFGVFIKYITLLLLPLPSRLCVDYDIPLVETMWEFPTVLSFVSVTAILVTAFYLLDTAGLIAFFIFWFFVTLAPTSSVIPVTDIMAVRHLYLPGLAFYALLTLGIYYAVHRMGERKGWEEIRVRSAVVTLLIGVVLLYSVCAYEHNKVWRTGVSLWEDAVEKSPAKVRPHYSLGHYYQEEGRQFEAWKQYMICRGLYSKKSHIWNTQELEIYSAACNNLAKIYMDAGVYNIAVTILREAVEIYPRSPKAHHNLGDAYLYLGKMEEAEKAYTRDIQLNRENSGAYPGLGLIYESMGMPDEAIDAYSKAVKVDPTNIEIWIKLSRLWLDHRNDSAKAMYCLSEAKKNCTNQETLEKINEIVKNTKRQGTATAPSR